MRSHITQVPREKIITMIFTKVFIIQLFLSTKDKNNMMFEHIE